MTTRAPHQADANTGEIRAGTVAAAAAIAALYKLTGRVFTTNAPSLAAHRAAGFEEVGVHRRHGRLDGLWKECVLVERLLGDAADN